MSAPASPRRTILLLANAFLILFAAWNLLDLRRQPFTGYWEAPTHVLTRVTPGSPAANAGLAVGDELVSVAGVSVIDSRTGIRQPRPIIGETSPIVARRAGEPMTVNLTYAGLPPAQWTNGALALLVGLCFGLFGLMAFLRSGSRQALLFAAAAACFAYLFIGPPYVYSFALRTVFLVTILPIVTVGFALLLRYLLGFPKPRPFLARAGAPVILWAPAALLSLLWLYLYIVQPDSTGPMNTFVQVSVSFIIAGYAIASAWVLLRTYIGASPAERARSGLDLMLAGVIVGFVPLIVLMLAYALAPTTPLPGGDYYFLTMAAIPITFAIALARHESTHAPAETPAQDAPAHADA